jgi:hypothetical protein
MPDTLERLQDAADTVETLLLEAYNKIVAVDEVFRAAGYTQDHRGGLTGYARGRARAVPPSVRRPRRLSSTSGLNLVVRGSPSPLIASEP